MPKSVALAESLILGIDGISMTEQAGLIGFNRVPPDTNGAVGPDHVVLALNHVFQIFDKQGNLLATQQLDDLFGVAPNLPTDPNLMYDHHADRWVFVAFEVSGIDGNPANDRIALNVAVSKTSDPLDGWHVTSIDSSIVIDGVNSWSDFPAIAVDEDAIYVTANMFPFNTGDVESAFQGPRIWIFDKGEGTGGLYDGGAPDFTLHAPVEDAVDLTGFGLADMTLIPARVEGDAPGDLGVYLIGFGGLNGGDLSGAGPASEDYIQVIRVDDPLGTPTFTAQVIALGDIHDESAGPLAFAASQPGGARPLSAVDPRVLSGGAVWRDGKLYAAFNVIPKTGPDAGEVTVHWVEIDAADPDALALVQQGDIGGEDLAPGTETFLPSLAVNKDGTLLVNFSASGPNLFAGAYYALRAADDPSGFMGPAQLLHEGLDAYVRTRLGEGTSGQNINRWGDFSGVSIDPTDDTTFWFFNMFAEESGSPNGAGEDGVWRTVVGSARATIDGFAYAVGEAAEAFFGGLGVDSLTVTGRDVADVLALTRGAFAALAVDGAMAPAMSAWFVEAFTVDAGDGADTVTVGDGFAADGWTVVVLGGDGDDVLIGHDLDDELHGEGQDDTVSGGRGADSIFGDYGWDTLEGGLGDDVILGGPGRDTILGQGADDVVRGESGGDDIAGQGGADFLTGGDGADTLNGGPGFDDLRGNASGDTLIGGGGDDVLRGGSGSDVMNGAVGVDTLIGANGNDVLNGGGGADVITGGGGLDTLIGLKGPDLLDGGNSDDVIDGGEGRDTLIGAGGDDVLRGGAGVDVMSGGGGADTFDFDGYIDFGNDADEISDFDTHDVIDLSALGGDFVGTAAFSSTPGEIRYAFVGGLTRIEIDQNGDGAADHAIEITNGEFDLAETAPDSLVLQIDDAFV